jgi:hypothetical protein
MIEPMSLTERLELARQRRDAIADGRDLALGLGVRAPERLRQPDAEAQDTGIDCPSCKNRGRIDVVDVIAQTAHLTCMRCLRQWSTSRVGDATRMR